MTDSFGARSTLEVGGKRYEIFRLGAVREGHTERLPYSLKILMENLLRHEDGRDVTRDDILALANWDPMAEPSTEISFTPSRVILQDFTGVPAVVDLAAMRDAVVRLGGSAASINPLSPAELVIDHSVQVDRYGTADALDLNNKIEFKRNKERYSFLRWGQGAFENFRVVPPNTGIVHQVNLEYLGRVVFDADGNGSRVAYPDTVVGTDSHTTMINGLGILGWGVGGIEAEAAMLGQPITMLIPHVIGFKLVASLPKARLQLTWYSRSPKCCGKRASSENSSSSSATGWRNCRWPTVQRSATCRRSSAAPAQYSQSTVRRFGTSNFPDGIRRISN